MDEYAGDVEEQGSEASLDSSEPTGGAEDPKLKKLQQENRSLRARLRRSELVAKYGTEVVGLIPDELPITKWESFADTLATRLGSERTAEASSQTAEPAPSEEPTPEELRLASVTRSASGQAEGPAKMPFAEWRALRKKDPAAADAIPLDRIDVPDVPLPPNVSRGR